LLVLLCSLFLCLLQICWDLQVSGVRFSSTVCSKELFSLLLVQGVVGTWVWFRVDGRSIRYVLNPGGSGRCSHSSPFFVTWFRARTRVRWVAHGMSVCIVRFFRVVVPGCWFTMYFLWDFSRVRFNAPPVSVSFLLFLIYLLFLPKKKKYDKSLANNLS
jgi:hypothetical protein